LLDQRTFPGRQAAMEIDWIWAARSSQKFCYNAALTIESRDFTSREVRAERGSTAIGQNGSFNCSTIVQEDDVTDTHARSEA